MRSIEWWHFQWPWQTPNPVFKVAAFLKSNSSKTAHLRDKVTLSLPFNGHFPREPGLAGVYWSKDDGSGGDNWSYKSCKTPAKSSPPTNQHPFLFYRPDSLPVAQPTVSKQSYYRTLIENHTHSIEWYHFQWPWLILDPDFKVAIFLTLNISETTRDRAM